MELLKSYLWQMFFTIGIIVIFGFIVALCRRGFATLLGGAGPVILLITGIVGTPVHELSHALACLIFGHKISEIKLYRISDESLGYVEHQYNPKNLYHQIGNFFIGIAPILGGSGMILLLMRFMTPNVFSSVWGEISIGTQISSVGEFFGVSWRAFLKVFDFSNANNGWWWAFIVLALMIAGHMELSGADIKGGIWGLLIILMFIFAIDALIYFIYRPALSVVTSAMISAGLAILSFLLISGIFSLVMLAIALLIKGICLIFRR